MPLAALVVEQYQLHRNAFNDTIAMKDFLLQCHIIARRSSKSLRMVTSSSTITQDITNAVSSRWSSSSAPTVTTGKPNQYYGMPMDGIYPFFSSSKFSRFSHPGSQSHSRCFSTNDIMNNKCYHDRNTNRKQHRTISSATKPLCQESAGGTTSAKKVSSPKVEEIFQRIILLDVMEVGLLTHLVNEKMGFPPITEAQLNSMNSASAGSGAAGGAGGDTQEEAAVEEKTSFELKLMSFDAKAKIKVIKEVRAMTGLGLKEAKELVEGAADGGKIVKKDIGKEEAEEEKAKLEALGAKVEIL